MVKLSTTASPCCRAMRSVTRRGVTGCRATGAPTAPHPARTAASGTRNARRSRATGNLPPNRTARALSGVRAAAEVIGDWRELKDIAAQVLILGDVSKLLGDVGGIHLDVLLLQLRRFKGNFVEHALEDGVQAAGADIFG